MNKRIAIVNQRYGVDIDGGSEQLTRMLAERLAVLPDYDVEVLTTCAFDYNTWANHYPEGVSEVNGVTVRRFPNDKERDMTRFGKFYTEDFSGNFVQPLDEQEWLDQQGPYCPKCIEYIIDNSDEYDVFIFVTYLYYLTARGIVKIRDKAILIPTAHDEPTLYLDIYKDVFSCPGAIGFNTEEERTLLCGLFDIEHVPGDILGVGVDIRQNANPAHFLTKYGIDNYILYVGRVDYGKNCPELFDHFIRYKTQNPSDLKLVLMGKEVIPVPEHPDIISLGFVSEEDKFDAMAGARFLVLPSVYESLSIVVLEAMSLGTPVVVNGECKVLAGHCEKSSAGLTYRGFGEFADCVSRMLRSDEMYKTMRVSAREYVETNYRWDVIMGKLTALIETVAAADKKRRIKLAFVTPWYGKAIPGGAEAELRGLICHLDPNEVELEVLTTCVHHFMSDWYFDIHKPGLIVEDGITVRRFKVKRGVRQLFRGINEKLMRGESISDLEEKYYITENVNSTDLYSYIDAHKDRYDLFVHIPYMFGTTYFGIAACPEKSVLIPCLHDEIYAYMNTFRERFKYLRGVIFHAKPESDLANRIYDLSSVRQAVLGEGLDTDWTGNTERFMRKYKKHKIRKPFILYVGRKDYTKNADTLIEYFVQYKEHTGSSVQLVMIGPGSLPIPKSAKKYIHDLGFIPKQDKYDAYAAALALCNPSNNESFSLVIMESWLASRPVMVSGGCEVTSHFANESKGGLVFNDYGEFESGLNLLLGSAGEADAMGRRGREYVLSNFTWDVITERYTKYFNDVIREVKNENGTVN